MEKFMIMMSFGIRPVAFFNKQCVIVRGKGTIEDPYIIEK